MGRRVNLLNLTSFINGTAVYAIFHEDSGRQKVADWGMGQQLASEKSECIYRYFIKFEIKTDEIDTQMSL